MDESKERQLEQLRKAMKILLKPMKDMPFSVVVEAATGNAVLPVARPADDALLSKLAEGCTEVVKASQATPFISDRVNEVSTKVERSLQEELEQLGMHVEIPKGSGGYPDRLLRFAGEPTYLEVKVSSEKNIGEGSARNFFYQPTEDSKIQHAARHLLTGFAIKELPGGKRWELTSWKIVDLFGLEVSLKPEYNANNLHIYRPDLIVMEGDANGIKQKS